MAVRHQLILWSSRIQLKKMKVNKYHFQYIPFAYLHVAIVQKLVKISFLYKQQIACALSRILVLYIFVRL